MQIIFHIDLNAFFANAEIINNPSLKGKPIAISSNEKRSIISTASYEAREYGIHSAMPLYLAKEKCPSLIIIEPHFSLYNKLSQDFFSIISNYSSILEIASIDECYVDMTDYVLHSSQSVYSIAKLIQDDVYKKTKLPCSIGVAMNKFTAKMASDMKKPMGITIITNNNFKNIIWPLPIDDMFGIGKKTAPKLKNIGINTIGDLAKRKNYDIVKPILGKNTFVYYQKANGRDYSKINTDNDTLKSIGHSTTFQENTNDTEYIKKKFKEISKDVAIRAKKRNAVSNCISITLKYTREKSITRQTIYDQYINDFETIYSISLLLFEKNYSGESLRLIGVTLNNVIDRKDFNEQLSLFKKNDNQLFEKEEIDILLEKINRNIPSKLTKASDLLKNKNK